MQKRKQGQKKKNIKIDDKDQSARFIEMAERIELVGNPEEVFERAIKKITKQNQTETT